MSAVTTEIIRDGLGNVVYRVSRIFPNPASASRAASVLGDVTPEAFSYTQAPEISVDALTPSEALDELVAESQRLGLYDAPPIAIALEGKDEDWGAPGEPPRCKTGAREF